LIFTHSRKFIRFVIKFAELSQKEMQHSRGVGGVAQLARAFRNILKRQIYESANFLPSDVLKRKVALTRPTFSCRGRGGDWQRDSLAAFITKSHWRKRC
jgi:hypothetical protein